MTQVHTAPLSVHDEHSASREKLIVVATCGDAESLGAVHIAAELARRGDASVHALTVFAPHSRRGSSASELTPPAFAPEDSRRTILAAVRRQLESVPGGADWPLTTIESAPADGILGILEHWPASLAIVGKGRHGAVDRLVGSETAVTVARRSSVPVLAIPAEMRSLPTHAAIGTDFTPSSIRAATLTAQLLAPGGTLALIHASTHVDPNAKPGTLVDVYTVGAQEKLARMRSLVARETQRTVEVVLASGEIVDRLLEYVDEEQCDLIGLGGHELSALDRFLFGSIRSRILRRADCSVLVAPHLDADDEHITDSRSRFDPRVL